MSDQGGLAVNAEALTALFGPAVLVCWDEEVDYFQVYGDEGFICETDTAEKAAAIVGALRAAMVFA